jgi:hypothetical protein
MKRQGKSRHDCHVTIMSALVRNSFVLGTVSDIDRLRYLQGIQLTAKEHTRPGLLPLENSSNSETGYACDNIIRSAPFKKILNEAGGGFLMSSQLGLAVQ